MKPFVKTTHVATTRVGTEGEWGIRVYYDESYRKKRNLLKSRTTSGYSSELEASKECHKFRSAVEFDNAKDWMPVKERQGISIQKIPEMVKYLHEATFLFDENPEQLVEEEKNVNEQPASVLEMSPMDIVNAKMNGTFQLPSAHVITINKSQIYRAETCEELFNQVHDRLHQVLFDERVGERDREHFLASMGQYRDHFVKLTDEKVKLTIERNYGTYYRTKERIPKLQSMLRDLDEEIERLKEAYDNDRAAEEYLVKEYQQVEVHPNEYEDILLHEHGYSIRQQFRSMKQVHCMWMLLSLLRDRYQKDLDRALELVDHLGGVIRDKFRAYLVENYIIAFRKERDYWEKARCLDSLFYEVSTTFPTFKPSLVKDWFYHYQFHSFCFLRDTRGEHIEQDLLEKLNLVKEFQEYMLSDRLLSVAKAAAWLTLKLDSEEYAGRLEGIQVPISTSTAGFWMKKHGAERVTHKKTYYTDKHESPEIVADRQNRFIPMQLYFMQFQAMWVTVELAHAPTVALNFTRRVLSLGPNDPLPIKVREEDGAQMVKIHVDYLSDADMIAFRERMLRETGSPGEYLLTYEEMMTKRKPNGVCQEGHGEYCKCGLPIIEKGHDESAYQREKLPSMIYLINGKSQLRPKTDGPTLMVSGFTDEYRGFSLRSTNQELDAVNEERDQEGKPRFTESPGMKIIAPGKSKDGYWCAEDVIQQTEEVMDYYEILYPNKQLLFLFDCSSNHTKQPTDGLYVTHMGMYMGGKQCGIMRSSVIEEGCLGPHNPQLQVGDTQHMCFQPGEEINVWRYQHAKKNPRPPPPPYDVTTVDDEGNEVVIEEGYVGKAKGVAQVLYERGLYREGMSFEEAKEVLYNCPDYKKQVSMLEEKVKSRGHLARFTCKYTPEMAGKGMENLWGWSKLIFYMLNALYGTSSQQFEAQVRRSLSAEFLPLYKAWMAARRGREYLRAYLDIQEQEQSGVLQPGDISYQLIERIRKSYKEHRCMKNIDGVFLRSHLLTTYVDGHLIVTDPEADDDQPRKARGRKRKRQLQDEVENDDVEDIVVDNN